MTDRDRPERARLPPIHAPSDRELVARIGVWEVRRHPDDDARFTYLASRTMLHLQLWHPLDRISVLTPSRLTGGRFEIARGFLRASVADWKEVVDLLPDHGLPGGSELAALTLWLVVRSELATMRARTPRAEARP